MHFYKYQGAGNDFILIDNRRAQIELNTEQITFLCNRHLGIGADGLMLLGTAANYDFTMTYYNSDGRESTMCGNGGRCITAFARQLGLIGDATTFTAIDGAHDAHILPNGEIALQMQDVSNIQHYEGYSILNTGSPHYVSWRNNIDGIDVYHEGRDIRNRQEFQPAGINVNFASSDGDSLQVRTYERGVEDETLSCGTGVTAVAIAATGSDTGIFLKKIQTPGGLLTVSFQKAGADMATNVVLTGPAVFVFEGDIEI